MKLTKFKKTKRGVIYDMYSQQLAKSKIRGHSNPEYSFEELVVWVINTDNFDLLYNNWVSSGYLKNNKPSINRLNDDKGYSFKNIELITWLENDIDAKNKQKLGVINASLPLKITYQYSLDDKLLNRFISRNEASRITGVSSGNISQCCNGKRKTAGGFKWKYYEA